MRLCEKIEVRGVLWIYPGVDTRKMRSVSLSIFAGFEMLISALLGGSRRILICLLHLMFANCEMYACISPHILNSYSLPSRSSREHLSMVCFPITYTTQSVSLYISGYHGFIFPSFS